MATWKKVLVSGLDLNTSTDISNNHIGVSDGTTTTDVTLGNNITFAASGDLSVSESSGTITYSFTAGATTNSFSTINAPNGTDPVADSATDTLNLTNGNGIIITGNSTTDTIDIAVPDGGIDTLQLAAGAVETAKIADGNVTFAKIAGAAVITASETIASNDDDTAFPTAAAVIDYVTTQITGEDLDIAADTGTGAVDLDSQSLTISGTANEIETSASGQTITVGLPDSVSITSNLTVGGNLTVNGTTTTINSTTISVDDKQIELAATASPDEATANGGGILIHTGDATQNPVIAWNSTEKLGGFEIYKQGTATAAGWISLMTFGTGDPSGAPTAGDGTFYCDSADNLWVYFA